MKHRRSIELTPPEGYGLEEKQTLATLPQWFVIHARCGACGHQTPLERRSIARRCGFDLSLAGLAKRLKCRECGNLDNLLLLEKLPRD
ncbi:hypothetical protein RHEC894_CH01807 [Rhizobium sp. CIAT894]|uniref:hypothetical protein n=1 Tax=Rhizobium sp. CIAT894 TaxID=2020312 RepID=UPI0001909080|nr:hypothetical protein [Rhizobium sp. CIAT894]ARM88120.1 hypothetical protein RHEC894_CH01807 [Rhizobium sp. CIAT894]